MAIVIFKWQQKLCFSSLIATSAQAQLAGEGKEVTLCKLPWRCRLAALRESTLGWRLCCFVCCTHSGEILATNYARRKFDGFSYGRGFNSRHLHHHFNFILTIIKAAFSRWNVALIFLSVKKVLSGLAGQGSILFRRIIRNRLQYLTMRTVLCII